jgi:hypothetical protein
MNTPNDGPPIPAAVLDKLNEIRALDRRARVWAGCLRTAAVFLAAMLAAMAVDWLVVLYDERWRWTLTSLALGGAAVAFVLGCVLPLFRTRSLTSIAREADQAHPSLEERYQTVTELAQSKEPLESRGSEAMIKQVAGEAEAMSAGVSGDWVVAKSGLSLAKRSLCAVAALFALFFALNLQQASVLARRFLAPSAQLSLTQLESKTGDIMVGRGEKALLEFTLRGKGAPAGRLFIRPAHGPEEMIPVTQTAAAPAYSHTVGPVNDAFDYQLRAGDGQTAWRHVAIAERPKLSQMRMRIVAPAYSHLPAIDERALPRQTRALEGSLLELTFQADQPLASMELQFAGGKSLALKESPGHQYRFTTVLSNTIAFKPVLSNRAKLDNLVKPSCQIEVYPDQPPVVKILTPSDEITVRPDDKLKIAFDAKDDFGLSKAELVVTIKDGTNTAPVVIPIPLKEGEAGSKSLHKEVELDLAQFHLKQDQEFTYAVRVSDTKQNSSFAAPGAEAQPDNAPNPSSDTASAKPSENASQASNNDGKATPPRSPDQPAPTPNQPANPAQTADSKPGKTPAGAPSQERQNHLASAAKPSDAAQTPPPPGSQPPPNNMAMRMLDAAQSSACQPMHVTVDEWGRSFEGQMREKQELAIDPVLKRLDELLQKAQTATDQTLTSTRGRVGQTILSASAPAGSLPIHQPPGTSHSFLEDAKSNLREADSAVTELSTKSAGTPYAFIGLQLHDIRETHFSPARQSLGGVVFEPAKSGDDTRNLEQAGFHIRQARAEIAALTKTYADVKRDFKLSDAMQRLAKMHQIFLEDTQAMLGAKKPVLNPVDRKMAEVDDAFVEKLQKLLEEKKKIMAELAKILADDPRMLRRYMAMMQLDGTTLRDQMTLLARRQQDLGKEAVQWVDAPQNEKAALAGRLLAFASSEQGDAAALAAQMHENMITWLPLDVPPSTPQVVACQELAANISLLATEASKKAAPESLDAGLATARQVMGKLRLLHDRLPELERLDPSGQKFTEYVANRMTETEDLITKQSGWITKVEAIRAGDFPQAAEIDQHRLELDTTLLGEKLDSVAASLGGMPIAQVQADALTRTVHREILPEETGATTAFGWKSVKEGAARQAAAVTGFAKAERQFDDLLRLIVTQMDTEPPPTDPGNNKSLDDMLAMLKNEMKAAETLGIPCRPINVSIMKDWMSGGSKSGQQSGQARDRQARAAREQGRRADDQTRKSAEQARRAALELATKAGDGINVPGSGPKKPAKSWNTLVSQLAEDVRQGRDNVPPEQYRQAIDDYFKTISDKLPPAK